MKKTMTAKTYLLIEVQEAKPLSGGDRMRILREVLEADLDLTPADYVVYGYLYRHASLRHLVLVDRDGKAHHQTDGYYIGVSIEVIGRAIPLKRNSIVTSIARLTKAGLISVPFKATGRSKMGSCYRVQMSVPEAGKWIPSDIPSLAGTVTKRGQGVKDRWDWYNSFYGLMGGYGKLRDGHHSILSAYLMLLFFVSAEWKKIRQPTDDDDSLPGWYATVDRHTLPPRCKVDPRTIRRVIQGLAESGEVIEVSGDIYTSRASQNICTYLLPFDI